MPTAVASAIAPQIPQIMSQHEISPKSTYPALAPSGHSPASIAERRTPNINTTTAPTLSEGAPQQKPSPEGKRTSPQSARGGQPPKIIVKKEPSSPEVPTTSRHRPRRLDLSSSNTDAQAGSSSRPSAPLTRDSAALGMHDVGLACLSPGFQTHDPSMQEQLQRSITVREQQRHIIESRLQKNAKGTDSAGEREHPGFSSGGLKTPMTSRKRPPPGLSIVPPSHEQFANERVIQSAPLHQTFTGRHHPPPHMARHTANDSSHMHQVPAMQTQNRLPPISDVFAGEGLGNHREGGNGGMPSGNAASRPGFFHSNSANNSSHSAQRQAFPSPGLPPPRSEQGPPQLASRSREYRSAEEAVADMTSGREDLRPKLVHYGGHQPPTPPSPSAVHGITPNKHATSQMPGDLGRSGSGRRRPRAEYERDMGSPPLGSGPSPRRAFGEGRDSPETNIRKKEEFMRLCARAWDLFHS